jgi:DNA-binding winged helix-turn-helix (wHTH) protein
MPGTPPKVARFRFGPFDLDPDESTLTRNGIQVRLQDLPFRLLVMMVERAGEIVTREEMRQHLWPENTFVEFDNSLGVAIRKIRESLRDQAEAPTYVATVPRRGYRFIAPVTIQEPVQPTVPAIRRVEPIPWPEATCFQPRTASLLVDCLRSAYCARRGHMASLPFPSLGCCWHFQSAGACSPVRRRARLS